jgi:hypothetical protein
VLALTLPVASVIGGAIVLGLGVLLFLVRQKSRSAE